jgi:hypothetical protein
MVSEAGKMDNQVSHDETEVFHGSVAEGQKREGIPEEAVQRVLDEKLKLREAGSGFRCLGRPCHGGW